MPSAARLSESQMPTPTKVRALPDSVINRIAAGEVLERPASAVKELVENSLDAGARQITVHIEAGGKALLRVTDDGVGMGLEDLSLAVQRHATSKLADDDLVDIRTLGFRGEALPSIGAVAKLAITSRSANGGDAHSIQVHAGLVSGPQPAALSGGTVVEVRELFYATPARLKFLKSDQAETAAIADVVRRLALAAPKVGFRLQSEKRTILDLAPAQERLPFPGASEHPAPDLLGPPARTSTPPLPASPQGSHLPGHVLLPPWPRAPTPHLTPLPTATTRPN